MDGGLWWRLALAELHTSRNVVSASLLDSSGSYVVGVFIYGLLHLLQEIIDIDKIILGSQIWHGW